VDISIPFGAYRSIAGAGRYFCLRDLLLESDSPDDPGVAGTAYRTAFQIYHRGLGTVLIWINADRALVAS